MTFSLDTRAHSETGLVRKNNQDSGYTSPTAVVVADGMGGAAAGDLASTVAIQEIAHSDERLSGEEALAKFSAAVTRANETIADLVAHDHSLDGMGTTVCGAFFTGDQLALVHIGDSRGYILRDGNLVRLTHDHSWVQSLIDEGKITEEEAAVHPHRSLVLKVLNGHPTHVPDTRLVDLQLGDRLLFCSDGLCGFTSDDNIAEILRTEDLDVALTDLVQAAHLGGGADNITIVLAEVTEQNDALDAREPQIIGAAADTPIPDLSTPATIDLGDDEPGDDDGSGRTPKAPPPADTPTTSETARYAPTLERRGRWKLPVILVLVAALLGAGGWFGWRWTQQQYYVADSGGYVTIHQGVDAPLLSHEVQRTDIATAGLPRYYRERVQAGITAPSLEKARAVVTELRPYAGRCTASATPTASPAPTGGSEPGTSAPTPATPSLTGTASPTGSTGTTNSAPSTPRETGGTTTEEC